MTPHSQRYRSHKLDSVSYLKKKKEEDTKLRAGGELEGVSGAGGRVGND